MASDAPTARQEALKEAEELLRAGAVSHNHLLFPRDAIEAYLEAGDWDGVERDSPLEGDGFEPSVPLVYASASVAEGNAVAIERGSLVIVVFLMGARGIPLTSASVSVCV